MSLLEGVIGLLAPPDCLGCGVEGTSLCEACAASEIVPYGERCYDCGGLSRRAKTCARCVRGGAPRYVWVTTDYAGLSKDLIMAYKFGHRRTASIEIANLMAETLRLFNTNEDLHKANYLVIGVPTATGRVRERGFDHAQLLAFRLAQNLNYKASTALFRLGQSQQVGAKRQARLSQKDHSYRVRQPAALAGRNVLLIDDVVTTGATLKAAAQILRQAGARRVDAAVFAKRI